MDGGVSNALGGVFALQKLQAVKMAWMPFLQRLAGSKHFGKNRIRNIIPKRPDYCIRTVNIRFIRNQNQSFKGYFECPKMPMFVLRPQ